MGQVPHNFFVRKEIICPICQSSFYGTTVNPRLFAADTRESDRHVTRYNWAQDIKTDILPHHYDVWHCPTCFFSALHHEFELTTPTARHKARWSAYRQLDPATQIKIRSLAKQVELGLPLDEVSITTIHALALWIHNLVAEENKNWMDLGRLYLRLAWLYRENPLITKTTETASQEINETQKNMQVLASEIDQSLNQLQDQFSRLKHLVELRHRETGKETYTALIDSMNQRLNALNISDRTFNQLLQRDINALLGEESHSFKRPPLTGLSHRIAAFWDNMTRTEAESTIACVEAFDKGLRLGDGGDLSVDAQLTVFITNIKLLERIGDFRRGLSYITDISKMAFSEKQDLSRKIRELEKAGQGVDARRPLIRQLSSVTAVLQNFSDLRDNLCSSLIEQEGSELENRLKSVYSRDEQLKILNDRSIPDLIYRHLEEKGWLMKEK